MTYGESRCARFRCSRKLKRLILSSRSGASRSEAWPSSLERYREALEAFGRLVFQTYRSRLYRAAALIALDRPDKAHKLAEEAIAGNPGLTTTSFMTKEWYRDLEKRNELRQRLEKAGLPKQRWTSVRIVADIRRKPIWNGAEH